MVPDYYDALGLHAVLAASYEGYDLSVRELRGSSGAQSGVIVDIDIVDQETLQSFVSQVSSETNIPENVEKMFEIINEPEKRTQIIDMRTVKVICV